MIPQSKTLPASEVKNNFGAIMNGVRTGKYREVIVENHGEPVAAIVDMKDLRAMKETKERESRQNALAKLRQARSIVQERIKGKLTSKQADAIADRFSRELIEDLEKEGKIRFERKST